MTRIHSVAAAAATLLLALAIAACGEDQAFIEDYNEATKPLQALNANVGSAVSAAGAKSDAALAKQFDELAAKAKAVNANLESLDAPEDAERAFDDLRAALKQGQSDLAAVADAARAKDVEKLTGAVSALGKDGAAIEKAENEVKRRVED